MQAVLTWLATYWWLVSLTAVAVISILNAATRHWSTAEGFKRWALFFTEIISPLTSKEVPGWVKLPLTSVPPQGQRTPPRLPFLLLLAGGSLLTPWAFGCDWQRAAMITLDSAGSAAAGTRVIANQQLREKCEAVSRKCAAAKDLKCSPLVECQALRGKVNVGLITVHAARVTGYSAIAAGAKSAATSAVAKVGEVLRDLTAALQAAGVL